MTTGMRKWMEKGCPDIPTTPAEVSIGREELRHLRDELAQYKNERDDLRVKIAEMEKQTPYCTAIGLGDWTYQISSPARPGMVLYALPGAQIVPSFADAYQGAMEEVAIWKKRALEAEDLNRKFVAEINGPTYMGEPTQPTPSERSITTKALSRMFLSLDGIDKAQPGYEWRKGWNDAIRQAMDYAQPAPSVPDDVLKDAERYRFLEHLCATGTYRGTISRKAVDAAMLAAAPEAKP